VTWIKACVLNKWVAAQQRLGVVPAPTSCYLRIIIGEFEL
jgi:hypothetical protein